MLEILDYRYGRSVTMVVTQVPVTEWHIRIPDPTLSDAVPIHQAQAGEIIEIDDGVRLEILNPSSPQFQTPSPDHDNDQSVALRLTYGDFSLLLTGDTGEAADLEMLASGRPLTAVQRPSDLLNGSFECHHESAT